MKIENFRFKIFKFANRRIYLIIIILIGAFFRFYNLNWDQNQHLHPDERFLTMVGNAMKIPLAFSDYFNPHISTFNPANIGFPFFVYGILPLTINKILAVILKTDTYNDFTLQGRFLSGLADLMVVFLVYKTVGLLEKKYKLHSSIKYFASFFYAVAVLPIQLSHFFAVDTFLNLFMFASFYFSLRFSFKGKPGNIFLSAIFFGLAVASKINAAFILPLNIVFLIQGVKVERGAIFKKIIIVILAVHLYVFISYFSVRVADPYYFQTSNVFDPAISSAFINNIKTLTQSSTKDAWFPPAVQWIHKTPVIFSLINITFFGIGLPYSVFACIGFYFIYKKLK